MLETGQLSREPDAIAPDGSEFRLASRVRGSSLCKCTLLPGIMSSGVRHRTIDEIWRFLEGRGQLWRRLADEESCVNVGPGSWLTIPRGAHFRFRDTGDGPQRFATSPPRSGAGSIRTFNQRVFVIELT